MSALVLSTLSAVGEPGLATQRALVDGLVARHGPNGVDLVDLNEVQVKPCLGCGRCADTHPGRCVHRDPFAQVFARIPGVDLLVLASPVRFGVWAPALKLALDRFMPLLVGQYTRRGGELHHQLRYPRPTHLLGVGLLREGADEAEALAALVARHAVNMDLVAGAAVCARPSEPSLDALPAALDLLEAP